ncbi:pseudaminic acid cytidylyltransferase [Bacteroides heparinolyticus]|uniref:pseudaminic acid cytidylyltransferase n=1 Tax=Prevotella heparinolytica TaxID=28113 RepID=UPI0035A051C1
MKNLAIIPARGGSKRIPRKNIKDFLGKPIIAYSIEAALNSGLFDEVMVSTDDEEIAAVAVRYGASVPFMRNEKTANDVATLSDVVEEVINDYQQANLIFDNICCILPTAAFVTADMLRRGFDFLLETKVDSVRPVIRFSYPIQRAFRMDEKGAVSMFHPEFAQARSQDLEVTYHDAGMFYWMTVDKRLKGANKYGFEISEMECQDIDNETDWKIAEMKYRLLNG